MKFGLAIQNDFAPGSLSPAKIDDLRQQVAAARASGFSSIWLLHHYLGNMPTLQPVPLIAYLADVARGMDIGTNMFILPLSHPITVAEEFATLDHLTDGHVIAGFGMGYRENEFQAFGLSLDDRLGRYEESVQLIRQLWSGKVVDFQGSHFSVAGERLSLPTVRPGGPPIWVGSGVHKTGARRAARLGEGWLIPPHADRGRLEMVIAELHSERAKLGRTGDFTLAARREILLDPDPARALELGRKARGALTAQYAKYNAPDSTGVYRHLQGKESADEVAGDNYVFTDPETAVERLKAVESLGVNHIVLRMQWFDLPQEDFLRSMQLFRDEVLPHFAAEPAVV